MRNLLLKIANFIKSILLGKAISISIFQNELELKYNPNPNEDPNEAIKESDEVVQPIEDQKNHILWGVNLDSKIDHILNRGEEIPLVIRNFELIEKSSKDKVLPRAWEYETLPDDNRGVGVDWNGTFLDSWSRAAKTKAAQPKGILIHAFEMLYPAGDAYGFPGKHPKFKDWAYINGADGWQQFEKDLVYEKAFQYFHAWFVANGLLVQYISLNEWWDTTKEEMTVIEAALFDARKYWGTKKGLNKDQWPKIGTNTLPIGQGTTYRLSVDDVATSKIQEYDFIDVHLYMIDKFGIWQDDFEIAKEQLDIALAFQKKYAPNVPIWVSETGAPQAYSLKYYKNLKAYFLANKEFEAIIAYAFIDDGTDRFNGLYMVDENGKPNETYLWILEQQRINMA